MPKNHDPQVALSSIITGVYRSCNVEITMVRACDAVTWALPDMPESVPAPPQTKQALGYTINSFIDQVTER
jgi:hypothetical protein